MTTLKQLLKENFTVREYQEYSEVINNNVITWLKQKLEESDKQYSKTPNLLIKYENALLQRLLKELMIGK